MKKRIPLWLLGGSVWLGAFGAVTVLEHYLSTHQQGHSGRIDWLAVGLLASAVAILVVQVVQRIRAQPTPEERVAFWAIFSAGAGTIGAVVAMKNGVPEVVATVRSTEEYWMLAGSGKLPQDHILFLTTPEGTLKQEP